MEKPTHDVGVEDILKRFRSKMEKSEMPIYAGTGSIQPNSNNNRVTGGRLIDSEGIAAGIAEADKRKMVWTTKPDMEHYNGIVKSVGTFIGKIFLYFAQVVTKPQQAFNITTVQSLRRLNDAVNALNDHIVQISYQSQSMQSGINALEHLAASLPILEKQVQYVDGRVDDVKHSQEILKNHAAHIADSISSMKTQLNHTQQQLDRMLTTLVGQERRLTLVLEEARTRLPEPFDEEQLNVLSKELDSIEEELYLSFEDKFRGTRDEVKERVRVFLPVIKKAEAGLPQQPVLDVGCGRGEWLEVLKEEGLIAYGLDLNGTMVEQCKAHGLKAERGDILEYLKQINDGSLGAVTGFHIIEHLPFTVLRQVFDETHRVLRSGGVVIFETPNPQNVIVGSNSFYLDPTHRHPLPGELVKFVAEACGFTNVEILPLHPVDPGNTLKENSEVAHRFNHFFYGPLDYAIIGWKA